MLLKAGDGEIDVSEDEGAFWVKIDHDGVGDDGQGISLHWVSGVTADELRAIGEAFIRAAGPNAQSESA